MPEQHRPKPSIVETLMRLADPLAVRIVPRLMVSPVHPRRARTRGRWAVTPAMQSARTMGDSRARPIVLVPGYGSVPQYLEPLRHSLRTDGYEAYVLPASGWSLNDARDSARELAVFASRLRREHDAPVILVGHSRGGLVSRDAAARLLDLGDVAGIITIATAHHGVRLRESIDRIFRSRPFDRLLPAAREQLLAGSEYIESLDDCRGLAAAGAFLASIYRDAFDGAVRPNDAFMDGWWNVPVHAGTPFAHVTMITHSDALYAALLDCIDAAQVAMVTDGRRAG